MLSFKSGNQVLKNSISRHVCNSNSYKAISYDFKSSKFLFKLRPKTLDHKHFFFITMVVSMDMYLRAFLVKFEVAFFWGKKRSPFRK